MQTRVGITGFGAISAAGIGSETLWKAAKGGISQAGPIDLPRGETLRVKLAAIVKDFDATAHLSSSKIKRTDRFTQFAHIAAAEAIEQAGLNSEDLTGPKTAAIIGSGIGGMNTIDDNSFVFHTGGTRFNPMIIPKAMPSAAASHVSITHQITGPSFAITSACASASQSIGLGMQMIRSGIIDRAIVGGSEACVTPIVMKAWEIMRVLSPDKCRPFSKDRNGLILGEGAGVLILESEKAITKRGAKPLAWLSGYGTTSDAKDIIQPDVNGAATAMQLALDDAAIETDDICYINAHGTGTVLNDLNEADAINKVFGMKTNDIPVSSTKSIIGHALGASGALEFIVTIKAILNNCIPPNINTGEIDPRCKLNLPTHAIDMPANKSALCNTFAFGGINASLVVSPV